MTDPMPTDPVPTDRTPTDRWRTDGSLTGPSRILLVGDLHANTLAASQAIDHAQAVGADLILQIGDFGYWPRDRAGQRYLLKVDARLDDAGVPLWFIPGNHEDWSALGRQPLDGAGLRVISDRIREVPIGHRWTWGTTRWLAIGGGTSVDRHHRTGQMGV